MKTTDNSDDDEAGTTISRTKPQNEDNRDIRPKKEAPTSAVIAVDMAGSIQPSSTSVKFQKTNKRKSEEGSDNDEPSNQQPPRFRYSDSHPDEWPISETEVFRPSVTLTAQEIQDQRSKLAANTTTTTTTTTPNPSNPSAEHSVLRTPTSDLSVAKHPPSTTHKQTLDASVPGAYSVDRTPKNTNHDSSTMMIVEASSSAAVVVPLQAVPVDESLENAQLKELQDQMNREVERRLSLERRMEMDASRRRKCFTKERFPIVMAFVILLGGIGFGVYYVWHQAPNNKETTPVKSKDSSQVKYPPPTVQECEAVRNISAVPNQNKYATLTIDFTLDVSYHNNAMTSNSTDAVRLEIWERLESNVIPTLVGCSDDSVLLKTTKFITRYGYLIANAKVLEVTQSAEDCHDSAADCVRLTVNQLFWLKQKISFVDVSKFLKKNIPTLLSSSHQQDGIVKNQIELVSLMGMYI